MAQTTPQVWAGVPWAPDVTQDQVAPILAGPRPNSPFVSAPPAEAPLDPPADDAKVSMPAAPAAAAAGAPVFAAPEMPKASPESPLQTQIRQTDTQLRKLQAQDANPYGSANNHPGIGGKILHALSVAGNIAGDIFAPAQMTMIHGTDANRNASENNLSQRLQSLTQQETETEKANADTAKVQAETANLPTEQADTHASSMASTRETNDRANQIEHPLPEYEVHDTAAGPLFVNKRNGQAQHLSIDGQPVGAKLQTKTVQLEVNGKPHQVLVNEQTGEHLKDLGESGEKPTQVHVSNNTGTYSLEEGPNGQSVLLNNKTGDTKDAGGVQKPGTFAKARAPFEAILDEAQQAHQLADEASQGNAEADVSLALSFFKTMRSGGAGGSGIRFTTAEADLIHNARSAGQGVMAAAQKVLGGGQMFTPDQRKNVLQVIDTHANAAQRHLDSMSAPQGGGGKPFPGAPAVGTVENGFRYNGGDPGQQTSWSAVKKGK